MMNLLRRIFGVGPKVNFKELLQNGAMIVDVRTKREFNDGHISGSINIPLDGLNTSLSKLKKDQTVITCCASGIRSAAAKKILKSKGFKEVHNGGGWMSLKRSLLFFIAAATLLLNSCVSGQSSTTPHNLTPLEFSEKTQQIPTAPILDVRTPDEYSNGHLINAKNVDWNGNDFQNQVSALDKSKPVFVYCLSGARSSAAAKKMRSDGFSEVYELNGGIIKWRAQNLPETTSESGVSPGMTLQQFEELIHSDKMVLIDFYAEWCAPCKKMEPFILEITDEMKDKVKVVRVDADRNKQLCRELKIESLPVLQLYKTGKMVWLNNGYTDKEDVMNIIYKSL